MLVSVIIPTYNRPEFTREAVESVLTQTFQDLEVIVVDDGSQTELRTSSLELRKSAGLKESDNKIQYYLRPHKGVAAARNFGVSVAKGKYIAFLDSDDLWDKNKLKKQIDYLNLMNEEPRLLVSGSEAAFKICYTNEKWVRNGEHLNQMNKHQKHHGWIFEKCLPLCIISASSVLMEKAIFVELGGFDEALPVCEDYDLWLRMALRYPIAFLDKKLIIKRGGHPDQLSRKYWGMDRFRIRVLEKLLKLKMGKEKREMLEGELRMKYQIFLAGAFKRKNYLGWIYNLIKVRKYC